MRPSDGALLWPRALEHEENGSMSCASFVTMPCARGVPGAGTGGRAEAVMAPPEPGFVSAGATAG